MSERYRILRSLGSGGMAEVFLALARGAEGFEKPVVIKRLHPHLSRHENLAKMFISEARLSMHLHHQNVVQVMDVGQGPEGLYLVMELVNGWDLSVVLGHAKKAGPPPEVLVAYVGAQVAAGLAHAFRRTRDGRRLLEAHRDISPSNILVTVEGEVKVADFGIARIEGAQLTEPGSFKGKVPFAAPEVVRGLPATPESDQFSLGVVLYRLLGQGHPYGYTENLVQYAELLSRAGPPPAERSSPAFRAILLRLLALRPEDRYPSWDAVADALGRFLAHAGAPANAAELARYLATLSLPPPPLETLPGDLSAPDRSLSPTAESGFEFDEEWQGGRVELDASGRLSAPAPPQSPARDPDSIIQAQPVPEAPLELAHAPRMEAPPALPADSFEPLPQRYDTPARRPRRLFPIALGAFVLLVAGGAALVLWGGGLPRRLLRELPAQLRPEPAILTIDSSPSGATVYVGAQALGETPLARENDFAPGAAIPVRVVKAGYRPWSGTFQGGAPVQLEVKLQRR